MSGAPEETEWRSLDTCPRDGTPFLAGNDRDPEWLKVVQWCEEEGQFVSLPDYFYSGDVFTHWCPIPPLGKNNQRESR